jgi:hypothetical protein
MRHISACKALKEKQGTHLNGYMLYRESNLPLDWAARNLFSKACPLLATEPSLSHSVLDAICLSWLVVLKICAKQLSVVKCSAEQKLFIHNSFVQIHIIY